MNFNCLSTFCCILIVLIVLSILLSSEKNKYYGSISSNDFIEHNLAIYEYKQKILHSLYNNKNIPSLIDFISSNEFTEHSYTNFSNIWSDILSEKWLKNNNSLQKVCQGLIHFIYKNNDINCFTSNENKEKIQEFILKLNNHLYNNYSNKTYWLYWDCWLYFVCKFLVSYILWNKSHNPCRQIAAKVLLNIIWIPVNQSSTSSPPTPQSQPLSSRMGGNSVTFISNEKNNNFNFEHKIMVVNSQLSGFPLCTAMIYYIVALKVIDNLSEFEHILHSGLNLLISQYYINHNLFVFQLENNLNTAINLDAGILDGEILQNKYKLNHINKEIKSQSVVVNNYYTYLEYIKANGLLLKMCPNLPKSNIHAKMLDKIQKITKHNNIQFAGLGAILPYAHSNNDSIKIGTYKQSSYGIEVIPSIKYLRMFNEHYSFSLISPILDNKTIGNWPYSGDNKIIRSIYKDKNAIISPFGLFQKSLYQKNSSDLDTKNVSLGMLTMYREAVPIFSNNNLKLSGTSWVFKLIEENVGIHYSNWVSKNNIKYEYTQYVVIYYNDNTINFYIKIKNNETIKDLQYYLNSTNKKKIIIRSNKYKMINYSISYGLSEYHINIQDYDIDWNSKFSVDGSGFILEISSLNDSIKKQNSLEYKVKKDIKTNNHILMLNNEPLIICPSYDYGKCESLSYGGFLFKYDPRSNQWLKTI